MWVKLLCNKTPDKVSPDPSWHDKNASQNHKIQASTSATHLHTHPYAAPVAITGLEGCRWVSAARQEIGPA